MSRSTVSDNTKEEVFAQNTGEVFITLLTISHAALAEDIYIASDPKEDLSTGVKGVVSNGIDYVYVPFELTAPGEAGDSLPVGKLRVDNISREIVYAIRQITSPADIIIQLVSSSTPDTVEANIVGFQLTNVRADSLVVEGDLTTDRFDLEPFPEGSFTPSGFPGIN